MDRTERVPDAVVRRLPGYYRHLRELEASGVTRVSSQVLGERMGLTASQIRQDMNCFGGFGQHGYGYMVPGLKRIIGQILGIDRIYHVVIVGAGNIGCAVACYPSFHNEGFHVRALFDIDPARIGQSVMNAPILPLSDLKAYLAKYTVDIMVIATPGQSAQGVLDLAVEAHVRGVWNFAPVDLVTPEWMTIANVHLSDSLMALSFRLHEQEVREQGGDQWTKE